MSNFTPTNSVVQDWRNLENVNQENVRILDANIALELSSFYPEQPCICASNIDFTLPNNFGMASSTPTTATFNFTSATNIILRFPDQAINGYTGFSTFSNTLQTIFASIIDPFTTITLGSGNYVCAQLSLNANDAYRGTASATLLPTTQILPTTPDLIVLFALTLNGSGNLTPTLDTNCCYNYLTDVNGIFTGYVNAAGNISSGANISATGNILADGNIASNGVITSTVNNMNTSLSISNAVAVSSADSTNNRIVQVQSYQMQDSGSTNFGGGLVIANTGFAQYAQLAFTPTSARPWYSNTSGVNSAVALLSDLAYTQISTSINIGFTATLNANLYKINGGYFIAGQITPAVGAVISQTNSGSVLISAFGLGNLTVGGSAALTINFSNSFPPVTAPSMSFGGMSSSSGSASITYMGINFGISGSYTQTTMALISFSFSGIFV